MIEPPVGAALNRDFVIESAERGELAGNWVLDLNRDLG
jgi:hypothetical protein